MAAKAFPPAPDLSGYATTGSVAAVSSSVTALSNQVSSAITPRPTKGEHYRTGRQWSTSFADGSALDALLFDISGFTRTTDPLDSTPCISPTTNNVPATLYLKSTMGSVRDLDVRVRYRYAVGGSGSAVLRVYGRRLDDNNYVACDQDLFQASTPNTSLSASVQINSSNVGTTYGPNYTDVASDEYRVLRFQVVGGVLRAKQWKQLATLGSGATDQEPDWQMVGDPNYNVNITEIGLPGLWCVSAANAARVYIHEVTITELHRDDTNLLWNPDAEQIVTVNNALVGQPVYWTPHTSAGNTAEIASATDPWGDTRNVFHVAKPQAGANNNFQQILRNRLSPQALDNVRRRPQSTPSAVVEWEIWSKGTNVAPTGQGRGAAVVMYYYNRVGDVLNLNTNFYVFNLGPDTTYGKGTWGWYRNVWRMPLNRWTEIDLMTPTIGLHDDAATGDLLWCCPRMRPVPA